MEFLIAIWLGAMIFAGEVADIQMRPIEKQFSEVVVEPKVYVAPKKSDEKKEKNNESHSQR